MDAVLDMALTTISSLAESYTSGMSPGVTESFGDAKDEEVDLRMDEDTYQSRGGTRSRLEPIETRLKEEGSDEESEDSDEILEVIG